MQRSETLGSCWSVRSFRRHYELVSKIKVGFETVLQQGLSEIEFYRFLVYKSKISCPTTVKNHVIKYCEKVYERSGKNLFWSIKKSCEVLNKLKSRDIRASSMLTYDFSTLYTTLPHNLIKDKLVDIIEITFQRNLWSCQKVWEVLIFLLDNIYIRFGSKLYRQIVGIPMGTNCAPLVADLFLFCYERDFMLSLSEDKQSDVIQAFNSTSRYLDNLSNIDNNFLIACSAVFTLQNFS